MDNVFTVGLGFKEKFEDAVINRMIGDGNGVRVIFGSSRIEKVAHLINNELRNR